MKKIKESASNSQSGVIAVVILLLMVVILTIGISIATRSSEEGFMTIQQEESTKVFNAAETGVEQALSGIASYEKGGDLKLSDEFDTTDASVQYQISEQTTLDILLTQGHSVEIPANGTGITIDWSNSSCDSAAALLITVSSAIAPATSPSDYIARHIPVDPCDGPWSGGSQRRTDHHFLDRSEDGSTYQYRYNLSINADDRQIRIKALYADTNIAVSGASSTLQYNIIAAAKNIGAGEEAKAIDVSRSIPAAPAFMDFTLVSGQQIAK